MSSVWRPFASRSPHSWNRSTRRSASLGSPGQRRFPRLWRNSASKLLDRLGSVNCFAADRYLGSPPVVECMSAMSADIKVLDAAYVEDRRHFSGSIEELARAAMALDHEIDAVKATSARWG